MGVSARQPAVRRRRPAMTRKAPAAAGIGPLPLPEPAQRQRFRPDALCWYEQTAATACAADRRPYHILVSEIMLQQTQVERWLPKYREWLRSYPPRSQALADAHEEAASGTWFSLRYKHQAQQGSTPSRASRSPASAARLPVDEETLRSFKASALHRPAPDELAFRNACADLDTNVARVLFRVVVGRGQPEVAPDAKAPLEDLGLMVPISGRRINQRSWISAALVCTRRRARRAGSCRCGIAAPTLRRRAREGPLTSP